MLPNPVWFVTPSGYQLADQSEPFIPSADPIGDAVWDSCDGDSFQLATGSFPPWKKSFAGRKDLHFCGVRSPSLMTAILPDTGVGSTDNILLGADTSGCIFEDLLLPLDDRAGVKTVSGVGAQHSLIGCQFFGPGSPHDPLWSANTKWGVHAYTTAGWSEVNCWKWSIFHEHGDYFHNVQGNHAFSGGGGGNSGGCDIFIANRMNEGPEGKGNVTIQDRYSEDWCVGQGGSAFSFRGGMPKSVITMTRVVGRLGCRKALAAPFNQNICGFVVVDSADETTPGAGDAAYPGGTNEFHLKDCDWELGTIYRGRTGMIRPALSFSNLKVLTWTGGRIKVRRPPGAYPIALNIEASVEKVAIGGNPEWDGWIQYHGQRYTTLPLFLQAHPECAM